MEIRYQKIILPVIIFVFGESNCVKLPQFWKVVDSIKGSAGATVKSKLFYGFLQLEIFDGEWYSDHRDEQLECNARLLHTMANDLKCPRATKDLKHFLGIMEFYSH